MEVMAEKHSEALLRPEGSIATESMAKFLTQEQIEGISLHLQPA